MRRSIYLDALNFVGNHILNQHLIYQEDQLQLFAIGQFLITTGNYNMYGYIYSIQDGSVMANFNKNIQKVFHDNHLVFDVLRRVPSKIVTKTFIDT